MTPIIGRTAEEAQAKYEKYKAMADWKGGMAKLSQYINVVSSNLLHRWFRISSYRA